MFKKEGGYVSRFRNRVKGERVDDVSVSQSFRETLWAFKLQQQKVAQVLEGNGGDETKSLDHSSQSVATYRPLFASTKLGNNDPLPPIEEGDQTENAFS